MKKSKVLIPAMALLLFSTAASITGTVAWFTSSRIFNTEVGDFSVTELDGNLDCTMGADVGTTYTSATNSVSVNTGAHLIDASLDATNSTSSQINVYRRVNPNGVYATVANHDALASMDPMPAAGTIVAVTDDDAGTEGAQAAWYERTSAGGWSEVSNPGETYHLYPKGSSSGQWLYRTISSNTYYVAVSWTMTFNYTFNAETAPLDIFLDTAKSEFVIKDNETPDNVDDHDTAKGFRIAFITSSNVVVWGNRALGSTEGQEYANIKHVSGTEGKDVTAYSGSNYFTCNSSFNANNIAEDTNEGHNIVNKIGSISNNAGTGSLSVTCVAWFEGTDPDIVSTSGTAVTIFRTLGAKMSFFARSAAPGA